jgi:hypothetical protein
MMFSSSVSMWLRVEESLGLGLLCKQAEFGKIFALPFTKTLHAATGASW